MICGVQPCAVDHDVEKSNASNAMKGMRHLLKMNSKKRLTGTRFAQYTPGCNSNIKLGIIAENALLVEGDSTRAAQVAGDARALRHAFRNGENARRFLGAPC